MNRKHRISNTKIISNALLKGKAEFVWLKDSTGKLVKVLRESLHRNETTFYNAGNDVDYDQSRHQKTSSPFKGEDRGEVL